MKKISISTMTTIWAVALNLLLLLAAQAESYACDAADNNAKG